MESGSNRRLRKTRSTRRRSGSGGRITPSSSRRRDAGWEHRSSLPFMGGSLRNGSSRSAFFRSEGACFEATKQGSWRDRWHFIGILAETVTPDTGVEPSHPCVRQDNAIVHDSLRSYFDRNRDFGPLTVLPHELFRALISRFKGSLRHDRSLASSSCQFLVSDAQWCPSSRLLYARF